jgi:hypothetical protein
MTILASGGYVNNYSTKAGQMRISNTVANK